jgi:hypothetical protein
MPSSPQLLYEAKGEIWKSRQRAVGMVQHGCWYVAVCEWQQILQMGTRSVLKYDWVNGFCTIVNVSDERRM